MTENTSASNDNFFNHRLDDDIVMLPLGRIFELDNGKLKSVARASAIEQLRLLQDDEDGERAHQKADGILCALLRALGCELVVDEFYKVTRWYS